MDLAINRDQRGPEGPAMAEINARALMFNLGREDAIDSTTSAKIARYAERKQLAYKLTDEGVLLLDGRGKKIHLRNGVVTLRNALGLHALPERIVSRCRAIGDNRVLNKQQQHTNVVTMLHVKKMALVDPRLLKSLRAPLPDAIDTTYNPFAFFVCFLVPLLIVFFSRSVPFSEQPPFLRHRLLHCIVPPP